MIKMSPLKKISLLFLVFLSLSVFLTAQGSQETSVPPRTTLRIADNVPGIITPGQWDGQAFSLNSSVYDYLVVIDDDGELKGEILTSWETSDALRWVLHIREGITFHDGSVLDAEDVIFTLSRTQNPQVSHVKQKEFEVVEEIRMIDSYTVEIVLKEQRPGFIYQLTDYNMAVLSSTYDYDTFGNSKPMGSGPYRVKEIIPKEYAVLTAYSGYWEEGYPLVSELQIYFIADRETALSMLLQDRADIVPFITPQMISRIQEKDGLKLAVPYQEQRFISMAVDQAPFDNPRIRDALKYAVSPPLLARSLNLEYGTEFNYSEVPIMVTQSQSVPMKDRDRDVAKAKDLLSQAGYPEGISVELTYGSDHAFNQAIAQTIQEQAKEAGITIVLRGVPRDIYFSRYWMNVPLSITTWGARVDPSVLLNLAYHSNGVWNESHVKDPELDSIIEAIQRTVGKEELRALYTELHTYFYEKGPLLNLQLPYFVAMKKNVKGYLQPLTMLPVYKYIDIQ